MSREKKGNEYKPISVDAEFVLFLGDLHFQARKEKKKLSATWYLSSSLCSEGDRGVGKPGLVTDSG